MDTENIQRSSSDFEEDEPRDVASDNLLQLNLEGYEGPIDVLLSLARDQKVDITKISILALAEQYISFIERAKKLQLEIAADYLVMAAWLAYLKSRLLLPSSDNPDEPTGAELAARLAFQMQRLESMQVKGRLLMEMPRLGQAFFPRGEPEPFTIKRTSAFNATLYDLLSAYADSKHRADASVLQIAPPNLFSMEDALVRLRIILGDVPDWTILTEFLPEGIKNPLVFRSAIASTFAASLELAKQGKLTLRQSTTFGPIFVRDNMAGNDD
ncbi:MAG: segregation/condensation protein A [Alphaproteobacteria bacterium]|nr:segregation/condensation protein A [Alphaproteobacteria bacterium]